MAPTEGRVAKPERRWDCRRGTPTQSKYRDGSWHSLLNRLKCLRKNCTKFDSLLRKNY